ncbi:MAG: hypothetical protein C5B51_26735 [Terriglobia bacterium]|nr:MAG: hypothetical protein C5B51_26735 [Terriglobia bacterium]
MICLALILLAASTRVDLVNELLQIPADDWRYVELGLKQQPALVLADFQEESGPPHVKMMLVRHEDMSRLQSGRAPAPLVATSPAKAGRLLYRVPAPGDYVLVIDNRNGDRQAAMVRLRVTLDFSLGRQPQVTQLSPRRQLTVILVSFAVFFGIVTYSARRLLRGIRH